MNVTYQQPDLFSAPTPESVFDRPKAESGRDAGMSSVFGNADPEWKNRAFEAVRRCATENERFIVDEVWRYMDSGDIPHDSRAMGPIMLKARRAGLVRKTGQHESSDRASAHCNPRPVWESRIYKGALGISEPAIELGTRLQVGSDGVVYLVCITDQHEQHLIRLGKPSSARDRQEAKELVAAINLL